MCGFPWTLLFTNLISVVAFSSSSFLLLWVTIEELEHSLLYRGWTFVLFPPFDSVSSLVHDWWYTVQTFLLDVYWRLASSAHTGQWQFPGATPTVLSAPWLLRTSEGCLAGSFFVFFTEYVSQCHNFSVRPTNQGVIREVWLFPPRSPTLCSFPPWSTTFEK